MSSSGTRGGAWSTYGPTTATDGCTGRCTQDGYTDRPRRAENPGEKRRKVPKFQGAFEKSVRRGEKRQKSRRSVKTEQKLMTRI